MKHYYLALRTTGLNGYIENNRIDVTQVVISDFNGDIVSNTKNLDEAFIWIKKNIKEYSEIRVYGDIALHSIAPYMYKNFGKSTLNTNMFKGTKISNITWKREVGSKGKSKKYSTKFIDISNAFPTIPLNRNKISAETEVKELAEFVKTAPEWLNTDVVTSTISVKAMSMWKKTNAYGKSVSKWLMRDTGDVTFDGKPIYEPMNDVWDETKKAFHGGFLWTNPKYQLKVLNQKLYDYDMNAMYPHIMNTDKHPVGEPVFEPTEGYTYEMYKVKIKKASTKFLPFIQVGMESNINVIKKKLNGNDDIWTHSNKKKPRVLENVTVNMNNYTYEYFEKYYEGEWEKTFLFACEEAYHIFKEYLDKVIPLKEFFADNKAFKNAFKQMAVAPFGKNAQMKSKTATELVLAGKVAAKKVDGVTTYNGRQVYENDGLWYISEEVDPRGPLSYIPVSESIASKSQLRMLDILIEREDTTVYIDTDGFVSTVEIPGLPINDKETGKWKLMIYDKGVFRGSKHYWLELDSGFRKFKSAGVQSSEIDFNELTMEKYAEKEVNLGLSRYGREIVDGGIVEYLAEVILVDERDIRQFNIDWDKEKDDIEVRKNTNFDIEEAIWA